MKSSETRIKVPALSNKLLESKNTVQYISNSSINEDDYNEYRSVPGMVGYLHRMETDASKLIEKIRK